MLLGKRPRKAIAATLLAVFITNTFAPTITYALTSGPTQPEATSFEPIDTTDMVNLQTGDFTYSIPLIDVPGPDGGYPLALSYHGGIQPNEDASWVGLGWSLNPGAITRSVIGLPDDWYNTLGSVHTFWSGGTTTTYGAGVNIGIANSPFSVSFGLSYSHDTYKGVGIGYNLGIGLRSQQEGPDGSLMNTGVTQTIGIGVSPYGGKSSLSYGILGTSPIVGPLSVSAGLSMSTNFQSVQGTAYGSIGISSLLGANISSNGQSGYSLGGYESQISSSKAPGIQTSTHGFNLTVPLSSLFSVSLKYSKTRYWTNENSSVYAQGSLFSTARTNVSFLYDSYSLLADPAASYNIINYPDPTVVQGGALPAYDDYNVTAQGLGGAMRPYEFQGNTVGQNLTDANNNPVVTYSPELPNYAGSYPSGFRFESDFSNSFRQQYLQYNPLPTDLTITSPPFDNTNVVYGNNDGNYGANIPTSTYGYSAIALEGSRHINMGVTVLPSNIMGYNQADRYANGMINGFSITNESGVTYHYGLPAYSFNEQNYQQKISTVNGLFGSRDSKQNAYAYTWYLTSITGPDFVDRNGDQMADAGDWGYWVNFEYGKWSNQYIWRNPAQGFQADDDNNFENCSIGTREVYYLNAIRTRSNIALFEKNIRNDAKGESPAAYNIITNGNSSTNNTYQYPNGVFDNNSSQSLELSHIYILNIADANFVTPGSGISTAFQPTATRSYPCSTCEQASYVLDMTDVNAVGRHNLESKAIRIFDFNYDYSLCPGTINSYDINNTPVLTGKLTLRNLVNRGKGGANLIPPTTFGYDLAGNDQVSQTGVTVTPVTGTNSPATLTTTYGNFHIGDMLTSTSLGVFCGVITSPPSVLGSNYVYNLVNCGYTTTTTTNVYTTKNPPYNGIAYDSWGMYKSDIDPALVSSTGNQNLGRSTTVASSAGTDAWCLHYITSPLGDYMKVNYQPDTYHTSVLNSSYSLVMQNITLDATKTLITFTIASNGSSTTPGSLFSVGEYFPNVALCVNYQESGNSCAGVYRSSYTDGITVSSVNTNPTTLITTVQGTLSAAIPNYYQGDIAHSYYLGVCTGNLWMNSSWTNASGDFFGGGIRVASITSYHSLDGTSNSILYGYLNNLTGASSGVTSYNPNVLDAYDAVALNSSSGGPCQLATDLNDYLALLYKNVNGLYPLASELPPPGVMYQYVTVTNQVQNPNEASARVIPGYTQYQFEVFQNYMVNRELVNVDQSNANTAQYARNWMIRKFTSAIGSIKRITQYDANNNPLSVTINHYLHDAPENNFTTNDAFYSQYQALLGQPQYNNQGFLQERYSEVKKIPVGYVNPYVPTGWYIHSPYPLLGGTRATLTAREDYPCIQTGQTLINYVNGTQTSTTNLAFDFYSGAVTKQVETDAYGNNIMTQTVPAYQANSHQYSAMGLKINTGSNKSMLTQVAEKKVWHVDNNYNPIGLISATATTWSDLVQANDINGNAYTQNTPGTLTNGDVWRMQSSYSWMPTNVTSDGTTPYASFSDFNWTAPASSNANWINTSNITLYDVYSKALEASDINGNYAATRMDYGDQKVVLTGGPARFYEIAYSGAEDAGVNQTPTNTAMFVQKADGTQSTAFAHTGSQCLSIPPSGKRGFLYSVPISSLTPTRNYQASVWVKSGNSNVKLQYDVSGVIKLASAPSGSSLKTSNGWSLVNLSINGSDITSGTLNVYCINNDASAIAYVDDFRLQPVNSSTTAYVYDAFSSELDYVLDNNNIYTQYVYDGMGRLSSVYKEKLSAGVFKTNSYQYNYSGTSYSSAAVNQLFTKNNCPPSTAGLNQGTSQTVSVPLGMFTSYISQTDANTQAINYAQDYANMNGTCICSPVFTFASGIASTFNNIGLSGTTVSFNLVFTYPTGQTSFTLGNITTSCCFPAAARTVPIIQGSNTYNVIFNTNGTVQVTLVSGTTPTGTLGLSGVFDLLSTTYYSAAASGTVQKACTPPQVGSYVTYNVPAYKYASTVSQAAANQLAQNDVTANEQNYANANGTCSTVCTFTWASNITNYISSTIGTSGTTGSFALSFVAPTNGYTGGTIGTIVGSCKPSVQRTLNVTDGSNSSRVWQVTINTSGSISITLLSGPAPTNSYPPVVLNGTYNM